MLLWCILTTLLVYLVTGSVFVGLLRIGQKKRYNVGAGVMFILSAGWKVLSYDLIICKIHMYMYTYVYMYIYMYLLMKVTVFTLYY